MTEISANIQVLMFETMKTWLTAIRSNWELKNNSFSNDVRVSSFCILKLIEKVANIEVILFEAMKIW